MADYSELEMAHLTTDEVRSIANDVIAENERIDSATVALLTDAPVSFGLVRMWQAYASEARVEAKVFSSRDDALAWLSST